MYRALTSVQSVRTGRPRYSAFSQGVTDYGEADYAGEVPVPAEPGDVVIHHWQMVHRAGPNTQRPRAVGSRLPSTIRHGPSRMPSCRKLGHATSRRNAPSGSPKGQSGR